MKFANATNTNRKSGVAQWRDLRFRFSVLTQGLKPRSLLRFLRPDLKSCPDTKHESGNSRKIPAFCRVGSIHPFGKIRHLDKVVPSGYFAV